MSPDELGGLVRYMELPGVPSLGIHKRIAEVTQELVQENKPLESDLIRTKVWPEKTIDDNYWTRLQSELMGILREYLAWQSWRKQPGAVSVSVARYANQAHWDEEAERIMRRSEREMDAIPFEDGTTWMRKAQLFQEQAMYAVRMYRKPDPQPLIRVIEALDNSYRIERIRYAAALKNMERIFKKEFPTPNLEFLLAEWEAHYDELPLIGKMYFHAYHTTTTDLPPEHYTRLKTLLAENPSKISREDAWDLSTYLINFCARQLNQGKLGYQPEVQELFDQMLEAGNNGRHGGHDPWLYKNMIVMALRLGQVEWAERYRERHERKLVNDFADNARQFCRAAIAFDQKDYALARQFANHVLQRYKGHFYGIDARILAWKCNFHLGEELLLASSLDAHVKFFQRHPLLEDGTKADAIRFFRFSLRYLTGKGMVGKEQLKVWDRLKRDILTAPHLEYLAWIKKNTPELWGSDI